MQNSDLLWTANICPFRRAGAYVGLSESLSHVEVTQRLLPRRGAVYGGGRVRIRDGEEWPLLYYAIRDPSACKVVPIRAQKPAGDDGGWYQGAAHALLIFPHPTRRPPARPANGNAQAARDTVAAVEQAVGDRDYAGFIITIGLSSGLETDFHAGTAMGDPAPAYAELCERIAALKERFRETL